MCVTQCIKQAGIESIAGTNSADDRNIFNRIMFLYLWGAKCYTVFVCSHYQYMAALRLNKVVNGFWIGSAEQVVEIFVRALGYVSQPYVFINHVHHLILDFHVILTEIRVVENNAPCCPAMFQKRCKPFADFFFNAIETSKHHQVVAVRIRVNKLGLTIFPDFIKGIFSIVFLIKNCNGNSRQSVVVTFDEFKRHLIFNKKLFNQITNGIMGIIADKNHIFAQSAK
ncbi:hypothetical protein SDC9_111175 [bioreactor metagenome]|uniref:Uncharacterized protein n=1 Tax=bioreactor metagenome TaxID=1076179 RepID=A0A645BFS2_9ZZZZ